MGFSQGTVRFEIGSVRVKIRFSCGSDRVQLRKDRVQLGFS